MIRTEGWKTYHQTEEDESFKVRLEGQKKRKNAKRMTKKITTRGRRKQHSGA